MEKGQIVEIKIEDISDEGQGIGRVDGLVVFASGCTVGDTVKVKLNKVKKNYALGETVEIISLSEDRWDEFDCTYLEKGCGGCRYSSINYEAQLRIKEEQVRSKLTRLAGVDEPVVRPIIGMEDEDNDGMGPFRYRNKAQFQVSTGGIITRKGGVVENLGEPAVGFFQGKSHNIVNCDDCFLQPVTALAAADALRRFMAEDNITAWDPKWGKGLMRHLVVKTGFKTGQVMVILVINGKGIPNAEKLIEMLDDAIYDLGFSLESVVISIKKSKLNDGKKLLVDTGGIMGDENIVIAGSPVIKDEIGGLEFEISPMSFYQVNPVQVERLYSKVRDYCGLEESCTGGSKPVILDLYCGVGTIGLSCASQVEFVVGIESVKEAVLDANRNAVINGIVNARFIHGKAEEVLPKYMAYEGAGEQVAGIDEELAGYIKSATIAILDPPRAGCRPELLEAVAEAGIARIVYVSCDPATQARDIKLLGELGYNFVEATPVDMFPWTGSVECVALLSR